MNQSVTIFLLAAAIALLVLPRRWAPLPLLAGACYMTLAQAVEIGPFRFTGIRLLLGVGILRILLRRERPASAPHAIDVLILIWAGWALISGQFREASSETLVNRLGMIYNALGTYLLFRCFCRDLSDLVHLVKLIALVLTPVALAMVYEQIAQHNLFSALGGVPAEPAVRQGRIRSQGPFAHAILAGTVGAVCAPLMAILWRQSPRLAKLGLGACLTMVFTCASSGPLMSVLLGGFALVLWHWRRFTRQMRIAAVAVYLLLDLVMNAPAYYVIARVDLAGGSTGRHRANLIRSAFEHLNEWWLVGTDYTRHWLGTGVGWSEDHVDITNHYLGQGVRGGLPLMILFILMLWCGFRSVGTALRNHAGCTPADQFLIWSIGASLFVHAATCISVAYFDQSVLFLYLTLALCASLSAMSPEMKPNEELHSESADDEDYCEPVGNGVSSGPFRI